MKDYIKPLQTKLKNLLPDNTFFLLDDGEQSFVVYPTNHINLIDEWIYIEVAKVVYSNITEYDQIIDNIDPLYKLAGDLVDEYNSYVFINYIETDQTIRLTIQDHEGDLKLQKDFNNINDLLNFNK